MYDDYGVIDESETYRARLVHDSYASAPDGDGLAPALDVSYIGGYRARGDHNEDVYVPDDASDIEAAVDHYYQRERRGGPDWRDLFERYLRIFHGTTAFEFISRGSGESDLVIYDTADFREHVGLLDTFADPDVITGDVAEWRAYLDGDVYGVMIEEKIIVDRRTLSGDSLGVEDDWQEVDSCWGYVGREYAESQARETFAAYASEVAA